MGAIVQALQFVLGKIVAAVRWIGELFIQVFVSLWELVTDAFCWVFEQVLDIAISALSALDLGPLQSMSSAWGNLPAQVLEVMSALGMGQCFALITAAIGVRLTLQLIPFTRLGS